MFIRKQDVCEFLKIAPQNLMNLTTVGNKLVIANFGENNKNYSSLIVVDDKMMVEAGRYNIYANGWKRKDIEQVVGNVYCVGDLYREEVRNRFGFKNFFVTITTQGIKDGIHKEEFPAVFDYLNNFPGGDYKTREARCLQAYMIEKHPKRVIENISDGVLSYGELVQCLENVFDDELALCKGLKRLAKAENTNNYNKFLFDVINHSEKSKIAVDEGHLKNLTGISLRDIDGFSSKSEQLALEIYDTSKLSDLAWMASRKQAEPATELLNEKYREAFGDEFVDVFVKHAAEIDKLPCYKRMFFEGLENENHNSAEANFLGEFTQRIKKLAKEKYGEKRNYNCLINQIENPLFRADADNVWNEMYADADKYISLKYNDDENTVVRYMFPEKIEQLKMLVAEKYSFEDMLNADIDYFNKVGKMQLAIHEYCKDNNCYLNGNLHFDLVNAGVESKKEAKRCLDIWEISNRRPYAYASPYNDYSIEDISKVAKSPVMQEWMYPVMLRAMDKGGFDFSQERMPSERTLFDSCKAWKICPEMPQRLAKQVGKHSLYGRMLAGAIFDKMTESGKISIDEWRENKHLHVKFYEELSRAEKMKRSDALKQYIPNTAVNRKHLVGVGLEEMGLENTSNNFAELYEHMSRDGSFDKMLAKPSKTKTTFSSRLLVETARRMQDKNR